MPTFMKDADRIVGGEAAPSMIPWQVAMLSGDWQFCGGTILDACPISRLIGYCMSLIASGVGINFFMLLILTK